MRHLEVDVAYGKGTERKRPAPRRPPKCYKDDNQPHSTCRHRGDITMDNTIHFTCDPRALGLVVGEPYGAVLLLREAKFIAIGVNPIDMLPSTIEGYYILCSQGSWIGIHIEKPDHLFVVDKSECIAVVPLTAVPEAIADRAVLCYAFASKAFGGDYPDGFVVPPIVPVATLLDDTGSGD